MLKPSVPNLYSEKKSRLKYFSHHFVVHENCNKICDGGFSQKELIAKSG